MKLHENRLPADDYHEISCLIIFIFLKKRQNLQLSSAANYRLRFEGKHIAVIDSFDSHIFQVKIDFVIFL